MMSLKIKKRNGDDVAFNPQKIYNRIKRAAKGLTVNSDEIFIKVITSVPTEGNITTKKMAFKTMVTELLWFLRGDTNIKFLVDNGCHIWDGDAYKAYKTKYGYDDIDSPLSMGEFITEIKTDNEFAKENGELGPIYGKQWRKWDKQHVTHVDENKVVNFVTMESVDQIANLINELKTNPDSRRLMVSAWNVGELDQMVLPPCHYGFQCYVRDGKYLSLMILSPTPMYRYTSPPTINWFRRPAKVGVSLSSNPKSSVG